MLDVYATEEEQVEQIKKWWKTYGGSIIFGVLVGLAAMYGWQYWQKARLEKAQVASAAYSQFVEQIDSHSINADTNYDNLLKEYSGTPYAALAAMALAKQAITDNDLVTAQNALQWAANNTSVSELQSIATIRASRVLAAQGLGEDALSLLESNIATDFQALADEVKGDILANMGKTQQAQAAYQQALTEDESLNQKRGFFMMKLQNIANKAES